MVRPRVYENNAARQAEYRARQAAAQNELHRKLNRLQESAQQAAALGDPLACSLRTDSTNALIDDLLSYFERRKRAT